MRYLIPCGVGEAIRDLAAFREQNMIVFKEFYEGAVRINYMGSLVQDSNPKVRLAFYEMLCWWMIEMRDINTYETLVTPYLLSGFSDPSAACQNVVLACVEEMGRIHEEWKKDELEDELFYQKKHESISRPHLDEKNHLSVLLPSPFTVRPSLGSRIVMRKFIPRLLPAIVREMSDWKGPVKIHAVQLLRTLLVFGEDHIASELHQLVKAFEYMCIREEKLPKEAEECMLLIGRYGVLGSMVPLVLRHIGDHIEDARMRSGSLVLLGRILRGASPAKLHTVLPNLVENLGDANLLQTHDLGFFAALLDLAEVMVSLPLSEREWRMLPGFLLRLRWWLGAGMLKLTAKEENRAQEQLSSCMARLHSQGAQAALWCHLRFTLDSIDNQFVTPVHRWSSLSFELPVLLLLLEGCYELDGTIPPNADLEAMVDVLILVSKAITENPSVKAKLATAHTLATVLSSPVVSLRVPTTHVDSVFAGLITALISCLGHEECRLVAADALGLITPQALQLQGAGALIQAATDEYPTTL
jgi:hypothetical protein